MVVVAACLALRASEIMGLQWQDFNWADFTVLIQRGCKRPEWEHQN